MFKQNVKTSFHIFNEFNRLLPIAYHHPDKIIRAIFVFFTEGIVGVKKRVRRQDILEDYQSYLNSQYNKNWKKAFPAKSLIRKQFKQSEKFILRPKISIVVPTYNTNQKILKECINSVLNQSYNNWQLCISDDSSDDPIVRQIILEYARKDSRISYIFRNKRGHISQASNSALEIAKGNYIGFLDHDDILWPNALFEVVKKLNEERDAQIIYTDEDKLEGKTHLEPFYKPDWSPDYLRSINYIVHFTVVSAVLVKKIGGFRIGVEGAQDWDLLLRAANNLASNQIVHIPKILYSWRKSHLSASSEKSAVIKRYAFKNQRKVLVNDLLQRKIPGKVLATQYLGLWRVKYDLVKKPLISIIIPTIDNYSCIKNCLNSIFEKTTYQKFEIIVVDTGSKDLKVFDLYQDFVKITKKIKLYFWNKEFNFSAVCNYGVSKSRGEYLVFLNNDTKVINKDWLENLLEHSQRKEIGAVGCKLLFPNGRIQHVGVVLGISGGMMRKGIAGHPFKNFYHKRINNGYSRIVDAVVDYSAVTAACLMVSKKKFNQVSGFDPKFRIAFNDVDFCLKLRKCGYYNLYTPYTMLYHYESASVGKPGKGGRSAREFLNEAKAMREKWGGLLQNDPFYNQNLTLKNEEYSLQ